MNTNNIKKYAPQARREFMTAVAKRLNQLGIDANKKGELELAEATVTGSIMQVAGNSFEASLAPLRRKLVTQAEQQGFVALVEHMAYTWFNRLCAIRYMELKDYLGHGLRVLSHPQNASGFEILDHAEEAATELDLNREQVIELKLAGNKDEALYRMLLLGQCHKLHQAMPFLFDALDDGSELLLPDNLTRTDSVLRGLVDDIPEEDWEQVEVIGWLYQFYISEKKDQVMGKVVKSEDIPAATQLFTPNWIVKYLVQNSVGRHWLQTYPDSSIKADLEYYIEPGEQPEEVLAAIQANTPDTIAPESIKVLDPACGSGHILIEAYNVLKAIYEDRGYRSRDIPLLILENNLFGIDIDDRAAQLSGFSLMMMARQDDRRIFERSSTKGGALKLNVLSMQQSDHLAADKLLTELNLTSSWDQGVSMGLFEEAQTSLGQEDSRYALVRKTLERFEQAKTFGSLINVPAEEADELAALLTDLQQLAENGDVMQKPAANTLLPFIHQAWLLAQRYDAVIANPPYMGSNGMNAELKKFAAKVYPNSKSDLFAIFMEHAFSLLKPLGFNAQINMQSWMFLPTYKNLREWMINEKTIISMIHLGTRAFSQISGDVVQTTAWVIENTLKANYQSTYFRLIDGNEEDKKNRLLNRWCKPLLKNQSQFNKIDGCPIAYWLDTSIVESFNSLKIGDVANVEGKNITSDNERFLRFHWEINGKSIGVGNKWLLYSKGGSFRKWYGNLENVINWSIEARDYYKKHPSGRIISENQWYKKGITWSPVATDGTGFRLLPKNTTFDSKGLAIFPNDIENLYKITAVLNSSYGRMILNTLNPTIMINLIDVISVPYKDIFVSDEAKKLVEIHKEDWDESELSLEFKVNNIIKIKNKIKLEYAFDEIVKLADNRVGVALNLELEINNKVNNVYSLTPDFLPNLTVKDITMYCNPIFIFQDRSADCYRSDSISKLISYAIGCMMGRYSLDHEGLIYAHAGNEGFDKLVADDNYQTFPADEDGIIPFTDQEWFKDDATNLFRDFVRTAWAEEHLQQNLDFVAESLCLHAIKPRKNESSLETIRRYLSTQFYKDHLKTYKKRPIYWLFSSGKEKAFECLVYLHRYNEGTLARMRTEYVSPLLGKYDAYTGQLDKQIENASSTAEANSLKKELVALQKKQVELREFDDKLKHYADMRISIDLDDGVKVNYGKFGDLLANVKDITGSAPKVK
ncbi:BREX-1 system adenine-specific DNA-methyltransferase PglX [Oceanisphaera sp. IT1-181]|uniref:BREX-1 system adenine-specific DNA-methyltransferase PglX n=1 Tax=Oceanisphaera sp. IT1-181 TaxID=3081199 RepID=UPI0029CA15C3|nr:BREX-1 system adenine-specific DNA-methyltransferase PglX [Oceanisphaera sp. IT1-181]